MRHVASALLVLAIAAASSGCGATCDRREGDPIRYTEGAVTNGVYETSPWDGPYLDFPGGRSYRLIHKLGGRPRDIDTWLSFDRFPLPAPGEPREDRNSNTAPGAGNQVLIEAVNDEYIEIRNDTCSSAFLRVVAFAPEVSSQNDGGATP